jgi:hypothetical protein
MVTMQITGSCSNHISIIFPISTITEHMSRWIYSMKEQSNQDLQTNLMHNFNLRITSDANICTKYHNLVH